ncbi:MAG: NAD(P)-dependent glycerol-3-phosphate dehydrogenase [Acidobacteriia bacterium]|nr:NAD(P)-dependent glycerol-3-phosphate dehydrogenase [Terriglobia bacterium]
MNRLAVVGAGSWGTALALVLAPKFERIRLWVYEPDLAVRMADTRENDLYLPGFRLPENIEITGSVASAVEGAEIVVSAVPSQFVRPVYRQMLSALTPETLFVSATKGIENESLALPSEVIAEVVTPTFPARIAVLSGPSFAREVAALAPTAIVIASEDEGVSQCIQTSFSGPSLRLYTSSDPKGVEIGGSIKNVIAIAAGVVHGLGLGCNALAALVTRGLAEMTRLAVALGGKPQTLAGLAGLGDLVLTCTGDLSRNRAVGVELAMGRGLGEILGSMRMIAEGVKTTTSAWELASRHSIEMPITEQMYQMLYYDLPPREAVRRLMERALRPE